MSAGFVTRGLAKEADVIAPDGSEVRLLASGSRGSMAHFSLAPGSASKAVVHRTVEELWFFTAGHGRMWLADGEREIILDVTAGVSLTIPQGTRFQFRCESDEPLQAVGVTMPPWPGADEAMFVEGPWPE
jgi:mannose-6-phosphate isomerase-like protein (cupin superfamily)